MGAYELGLGRGLGPAQPALGASPLVICRSKRLPADNIRLVPFDRCSLAGAGVKRLPPQLSAARGVRQRGQAALPL